MNNVTTQHSNMNTMNSTSAMDSQLNASSMTDSQRENTVDVLKDLVNYTVDSIKGYERSEEMVRDNEPELADYFRECASKRQEKRDELIRLLNMVEPHDASNFDGTNSGAIHQAFSKFRSMFQNDSKAALAEVERGEDFLGDKYEDALEKDLPETLKGILSRHHADIERREDMAEDLLEAS